jgi:catechol 2,3-dioxygenase-like lactoylglutathione lyase family enzyme
MSFSPVRLNHAVLFVADLERSERFYREVFGMEVIAREPRANAALLRLPRSGNHHDLGLFGIGSADGPKRRGLGLYHLAWQLDTIDELAAARDVLLTAGAYSGESSHGATKSIYGADPDGNEFEIMWMLPRGAWGQYENAAPVEQLDLAGDVRRWSASAPPGRSCPRKKWWIRDRLRRSGRRLWRTSRRPARIATGAECRRRDAANDSCPQAAHRWRTASCDHRRVASWTAPVPVRPGLAAIPFSLDPEDGDGWRPHGLWPLAVSGPFDVPFRHLAFDEVRVGAASAVRVEPVQEQCDGVTPTVVSDSRGENRAPLRGSGGRRRS